MKIAVFGGTGFVGSYIIDELLNNGHEPVVLVRKGSESKLSNSEKCEIISGKYLPKKENSKKQIATITSGTPITRLVDSRRAKIPNDPINNSIGKIN